MSDNRSADCHLSYLQGYIDGQSYPMSDQARGVQVPVYEKAVKEGQKIVRLPDPLAVKMVEPDILKCLDNRVSSRVFKGDALTLDELSFLLWAAQGIKKKADDDRHQHHAVKRTVPSAGSRHPFETYVAAGNVEGLAPGIYRYLASVNSLVLESVPEDLADRITEGAIGQRFCGVAPAFFLWSVVPYRTVWRYGLPFSIKAITLDGGHIGQNLHIACVALGLGTCMIGAYNQQSMDALFGFDGKEEFAFYMAPVGRID
jgi:SagB-type dehydrogenase family enzyme